MAVILLQGITACSHSDSIKPIKEPSKLIQNLMPIGPTNISNVFKDQAEAYGLKDVKAVHLYSVDLNNDHFTDLIVLEDYFSVPKFYLFNGKLNKFEIIANPFDEIVRVSFLNFVDLDHDGIYDLIAGNLNQKTEMTKFPPRIFKGLFVGGEIHFKEENTLLVGLTPSSNISVLDYDLDGELDLFISNWFDFTKANPIVVPNILLKGSGFKFENVSYLLKGEFDKNRSSKEYSMIAPTFGASVCDVDQNGFPDILTNSSNGYYNKLWMNLEKFNEREFQDFAVASGYAADDDGGREVKGGGNSFFTLCGDYNNDGIVDLALGNLFHARDLESRDRSSILTGSTNKFPPNFIRSEFYQDSTKPNWSEGDRRGIFLDYNLDGLDDLLIENSGFPPDSRLIFFKQGTDHAYEDIAKEIGVDIVNPSGVISLDLNKDGVMDFIVSQTDVRSSDNKGRIYVFVNQTKREKKGSIRFHLQGRQANTHGISGSIYLKTNLRKYYKNVSYNFGSLPSQNEEGLYFAFDFETPETVSVNWPLGIKDRLGRIIPLVKNYSLKKLKLKSIHTEYNLCEDGRILASKTNCY